MRSLATLLALLCLIAPAVRAADAPDPVLLAGLEAAKTNGIDAAVRAWYVDRPATAAAMREKLLRATLESGTIFDTEIVAVQTISRRVTRYYVAVYFADGPLWLRLERYAGPERSFYLPLRFSFNPDEILPGYVTEFRH